MSAAPGGKSVVHPLTRQVYSLTAEGLVEVFDPQTGQKGLFDAGGNWQSGDVRHADLQIAGWVGRVAKHTAP